MATARSTSSPPRIIASLLLGIAPFGCNRDPLDVDDEPADTQGSSTSIDPGSTGGTSSSTTTPTGSPTGIDETTSADETAAEAVCGDGVIGPGETCDDGNAADGDGCSASCQDEPCTLEWSVADPIGSWGSASVFTPTVLSNDQLVIAHWYGEGAPVDSRISWVSATDGALLSTLELSLTPEQDFPQSLAVDPGGDVFLGSTDYAITTAQVRRVSPDGTEHWAFERPEETFVGGLALTPAGELVMTTTAYLASDQWDVMVRALDPTTGSELWSNTFGGRPEPDGGALDLSLGLVVDELGRTFVAHTDAIDQDMAGAWVIALAPDGDPVPLWHEPIWELLGADLLAWRLALGPDGLLVALVRAESSPQFWVIGIDADTGEVQWVVAENDLSILTGFTTGLLLDVSDERVLVAGFGGEETPAGLVPRTFVLGLDLDGDVVCTNILVAEDTHVSLPYGIAAAPDGAFYLTGYRHPIDIPGEVPFELFRMRVR